MHLSLSLSRPSYHDHHDHHDHHGHLSISGMHLSREHRWNHLFKHVDIKPENVHIPDGCAEDLEEECRKYEAAIKAHGGIELFLGGMGQDGHIAFNEPGSSLSSVTRIKTLAYETVIANARFFDNDVGKVPKMALTVGIKTILDAREVMIIVTGQNKSYALNECIEKGIVPSSMAQPIHHSFIIIHSSFIISHTLLGTGVNHMFTLSALQMHPCACLVVDDDATGELRVRTVRYFKGLERVMQEFPHGKISAASIQKNEEDEKEAESAAADVEE